MASAVVKVKRVYEAPQSSDGLRILVDRLWPRGLTKAEASIDVWLKQIAPSPELRRWFGHEPARWDEFRRRYKAELQEDDGLGQLQRLVAKEPATLVYAARDQFHNGAVVLRDLLLGNEL